MLPIKLIQTSSDILKTAIKSSQPADQIVSKLLREKKYIGSKERRFVSESIFCIMRNLYAVEELSELIWDKSKRNDTFYNILTLLLITNTNRFDWQFNPVELLKAIYPNKTIIVNEFIYQLLSESKLLEKQAIDTWIDEINSNITILSDKFQSSSNDWNMQELEKYYSCPTWILDNTGVSDFEYIDFAKALNVPAKVCLRVTNSSSKHLITNMLEQNNIPYHNSELLQDCLILDKRAKIDNTDEYKSGLFEVQDEGSQLIAHSLAPTGNSTILDACAGAGGKTLHLAKLCPNAKSIVASDSEYLRIRELSKRLLRYNYDNIVVSHAKDMDIKYLTNLYKGKLFDYVLVDAPCTGIGTSRRDPLKKYRTTLKIAEKLQKKQLDILNTYSQFVKPGGILLYATCSFLKTENEDTINTFLASNLEFEPDDLYKALANQEIYPKGLNPEDYHLTLYPHIHGTDGFFMARIKRKIFSS